MNLAELQKKLIAAARTDVPGDQVPYAFEKRITALLARASRRTTWRCGCADSGARRFRASPSPCCCGAWAVFNPADGLDNRATSRRILRARCWRRWTKATWHSELLESHSGDRGDFWRGGFDRRPAGEFRRSFASEKLPSPQANADARNSAAQCRRAGRTEIPSRACRKF